jgi:peptidoglycan-N-acetylglucosamine deacetylase
MKFYLTIDDGPSRDFAAKLSFCVERDIKAVWFCLGKQLDERPEAAIRAIKEGHVIANHSFDHPHFSEISLAECREQIVQTEKVIETIYRAANIPRPAKFFRFPYGKQGHFDDEEPSYKPEKLLHKEKLQRLLKELGFQSGPFSAVEYHGVYSNQPADLDWLWSYDIQEWLIDYRKKWAMGYRRSPASTFSETKENLRAYLEDYDRSKEQIILIHDHERTAAYFPELLQMLLDSGITFTLPRPR